MTGVNKDEPEVAATPSPKKKLSHQQLELEKRLNKEIAPFTLQDLPLSENEEDDLFASKYFYQKMLGAGSFGVVVAAVDRAHLEECAIKVICFHFIIRFRLYRKT